MTRRLLILTIKSIKMRKRHFYQKHHTHSLLALLAVKYYSGVKPVFVFGGVSWAA